MIAEKKCKGQGKAKTIKGCGKLVNTKYRKYGLCTSCYADFILNTEYGKILLEKAILKATKPRLDLEKAKIERKENNNLSTLLKNVTIICHKYIRERDKYKPCISCGEAWNDRHQAGHFYKSELFSTIRFNEYNINGQCEGCNIYKEGNEGEYRVNLPLRIGIDNYRELERLASLEKQTNHKWNRTHLIQIREYYKQKLKELN